MPGIAQSSGFLRENFYFTTVSTNTESTWLIESVGTNTVSVTTATESTESVFVLPDWHALKDRAKAENKTVKIVRVERFIVVLFLFFMRFD